jgi:hypothetical protein
MNPLNYASIPLTQGIIALVDIDDYERISRFDWYAYKNRNTFYAGRNVPGISKAQDMVLMHREILGLSRGDGIKVDHRNRNGLDNRRENLRVASTSINNHNRRIQSNNTSGYRGVSWHKDAKKWSAGVTINGKWRYLGLHNDIISAAKTRDLETIKIYGKDSVLNFPERNTI